MTFRDLTKSVTTVLVHKRLSVLWSAEKYEKILLNHIIIIIIVCNVFNDVVSSSDFTTMNDRMISG
jgi:hypothetical protein